MNFVFKFKFKKKSTKKREKNKQRSKKLKQQHISVLYQLFLLNKLVSGQGLLCKKNLLNDSSLAFRKVW